MDLELIGMILALTVAGSIVWMLFGFCIALIWYEDAELTSKQATGLCIAWPVVLLIKAYRGIMYLVQSTYQGIAYVAKDK